MSTKPTVTLRELKNKVTGIDLMVPDYVEKSGKLSKSALYNVIVITRLFYYKSKGLKESDVVQFTVQKTYEEFVYLHEKLSGRFPSVLFPNLPKKSLITNSNTFQERRRVFDELMHLVARTQKLCCSPMILEFLGVRKPEKLTHETIVVSDDLFDEKTAENLQSTPNEEVIKEEQAATTEASKEEQGDIFVPVDLDSSHLSDVTAQGDVFSAANSAKLELHASLFEDEIVPSDTKDDTDLFVPKDAEIDVQRRVLVDDNENTDDLLNVDDDDGDDLLALSKKSERKSSIKASSSTRPVVKPKPQSRTSFESGQGDDDLSLLSSSAKSLDATQQIKEEDIFVEARSKNKTSLRGKKERQSKADTLDDIFGKSSNSKNIFARQIADDDLFSSSATSSSNAVGNLNQDDITKYINDNLNSEAADLGL